MKLAKVPLNPVSDLRPPLKRKHAHYSAKPRTFQSLYEEAVRNADDNYVPWATRLKEVKVDHLSAARYALGLDALEATPSPVEEVLPFLGGEID